MTRTELAAAIADEVGLARTVVDGVLQQAFAEIGNQLANGTEVTIFGFGKLEVRDRAARQSHNPNTGETIYVPAKRVPAFKASKMLKERVA